MSNIRFHELRLGNLYPQLATSENPQEILSEINEVTNLITKEVDDLIKEHQMLNEKFSVTEEEIEWFYKGDF